MDNYVDFEVDGKKEFWTIDFGDYIEYHTREVWENKTVERKIVIDVSKMR